VKLLLLGGASEPLHKKSLGPTEWSAPNLFVPLHQQAREHKMTADIVHEIDDVNLPDLAAKICYECDAVELADRTALDHAIAAGKFAAQAHKLIDRGFRRWLHQYGLKKSTIYDYMKLAQHETSVRSSGHSSIAAALRALRAKSGNSKRSSKSTRTTGSALTKAAWTKATPDERRLFLDAVGADSICAALSFTLRAELRRRVAGQQRATTSILGETVTKAFRQALSLQKVSKPKDTPAIGIACALNAINNKLAAADLDLNNIVIVIDPIATQKRAA
jgi:hypothetical protein